MDPTTLAAGAVAALVPYLGEAGKAVAKKAGDAAWGQCEKLWTFLRGRLTGTSAQEALEDLQKQPGDADVQGQARLQLRKALQADPTLVQELAALLQAAQTEARQYLNVTGDNNTIVQSTGSSVSISEFVTPTGNISISGSSTGITPVDSWPLPGGGKK